ncbi:uncharacterized protein [Lolium perenne]|uniref:uncharacterized protein isoform X2 n=1 Tax=Lolium perenne TaxID=4522 RepID=UPI003A99FE15
MMMQDTSRTDDIRKVNRVLNELAGSRFVVRRLGHPASRQPLSSRRGPIRTREWMELARKAKRRWIWAALQIYNLQRTRTVDTSEYPNRPSLEATS